MNDVQELGVRRKQRSDDCLTEYVDSDTPVGKLIRFISDLRVLYMEERSAYERYYTAWIEQYDENEKLRNPKSQEQAQKELNETKRELNETKEELNQAKIQIDELRDKLEEVCNTIKNLENILEDTRSKAKKYEQDMDKYAQDLEKDIDNLQEDKKKLELDKQELEDMLRKCLPQEECEKLRADNEHLLNQVTLLNKNYEEKKRELEEQTGLLRELQRKFDELEKPDEDQENHTEQNTDAELKTRLDQMELELEKLGKVQEENKSLKAERELLKDDDHCDMTRILMKEAMFIDWASGCEADLQSSINAKKFADDPAARKAYIQSQMLRYVRVNRLMEDLKAKEEEIETLKLKLSAAQTRAELDSANKGIGGESGSSDTSDQVRRLEDELKRTQQMNHRLHVRCALWFNGVKGDMQAIDSLIKTTLDSMIAMRQERDVTDRISSEHPMMVFFEKLADLKRGLLSSQK